MEKTCPICGKKFLGRKSRVYCNKKCKYKAKNAARKRRDRHAATKEMKTCIVCGAVLKNWQHKFCSDACKKEDAKQEKRDINLKILRPCHDCGKPTSDYRCRECWEKLRRGLGISMEADGYALSTYGVAVEAPLA